MNKRIQIILIISFLCLPTFSGQFFHYGDEHTFWQFDVVRGEKNLEDGYYLQNFTCVREGKHSYVFVENGLDSNAMPTTEYVDALFQKFEEIYPIITEYFGPPSDLDNNERFIILISNIRDWFYYGMEVDEYTQPIQGYYWFQFNIMNKNDYLTMDSKQNLVDATGTMAHEYFHNIFDNVNPDPINFKDRAVNEALAHYAVYINRTLELDSYIQWQFSILKKDLVKGKLLDPFDGMMDYFDIKNPDLHHCYAAGFLFIHYIADEIIVDKYAKQDFFRKLIFENVNASSKDKLISAMYKTGLILDYEEFHNVYYNHFKKFLMRYFNMN
ncbi:MAG: hypothetical protein WC337_06985 [Candidatus Muiribacteriota bacterium]